LSYGVETTLMNANREEIRIEVGELLSRLIEAQSENPLGTEEAAGKVVAEFLERESIEVSVSLAAPGRPNVLGKIVGAKSGPSLLFNGHLDTVPAGKGWSMDPFTPVLRNGKIYGRGAADMKGGVASIALAGALLKRQGCPFAGTLYLLLSCDEELSNLGMHHFHKDPVITDYVVIGEPTDVRVCSGHRGVARAKITTHGAAGHTGVIQHPDNAIQKMTVLVQALRELDKEVRLRAHPSVGSSSITVSMIEGGIAPNIVPSDCTIQIDRRTLPGETQETVMAEIEECLRKAAEAEEIEYDLTCNSFVPATHLAKDHRLMLALSEALETATGVTEEPKPFNATTEAPFFSVSLGIPSVIFGPGSIANAHIVDEYIEVEQLVDATITYVELAKRLLYDGET
jgi:acetylornithine deacetylase/succinyl-diaminopimelate desuccinylase family protein